MHAFVLAVWQQRIEFDGEFAGRSSQTSGAQSGVHVNLGRVDVHKSATAAIIAGACILLAPPLALDGRLSALELSLALLAMTMVLAVFSPKPPKVLFASTLVFALLTLMALSALWSVDAVQTLRDVATVLALVLAATILVQSASVQTIIMGVALSGALVLAWTLVWVVLRPESAFSEVGALIGPYGNRNGLAYTLLQTLPAALAISVRSRWSLAAKAGYSALLCFAIYSTQSKTSLLVMAVVVFAAVAVLLLVKSKKWGWVLGPIAVGAVVAAATNFSTVLAIIGKSASLNGRAQIWDTLVGVAAQSPLIGYGWSLSWPQQGFPSMKVASRLRGVVVYHAHNEMLNWMVTTGILGVLLVLAIYAFIIWRGIGILRLDTLAGIWVILAGVVLLTRGISEISETQPQGWFIFSILAAVAAQAAARSSGSKMGELLVFTLPTSARIYPRTESGSVVA
ncbi:O-antigen ligase family protein [Rhodoglobus sp. NPDC076762]